MLRKRDKHQIAKNNKVIKKLYQVQVKIQWHTHTHTQSAKTSLIITTSTKQPTQQSSGCALWGIFT